MESELERLKRANQEQKRRIEELDDQVSRLNEDMAIATQQQKRLEDEVTQRDAVIQQHLDAIAKLLV